MNQHSPAHKFLSFLFMKIRSWIRKPRKTVSVSLAANPFNGEGFKVNTFDLSESGAFLTFSSVEAVSKKNIQGVLINSGMIVCLQLGALRKLRCEARIVRIEYQGKGIYPPGIGILFVGLDRQQKRQLRRYMASSPTELPATLAA